MNEETKIAIRKIFDEQVRPALKADGGDGEIVDITEEGIVKVRLLGSCVGCPFASMTLAYGIEQKLKEKFPQVKKVEAVV